VRPARSSGRSAERIGASIEEIAGKTVRSLKESVGKTFRSLKMGGWKIPGNLDRNVRRPVRILDKSTGKIVRGIEVTAGKTVRIFVKNAEKTFRSAGRTGARIYQKTTRIFVKSAEKLSMNAGWTRGISGKMSDKDGEKTVRTFGRGIGIIARSEITVPASDKGFVPVGSQEENRSHLRYQKPGVCFFKTSLRLFL